MCRYWTTRARSSVPSTLRMLLPPLLAPKCQPIPLAPLVNTDDSHDAYIAIIGALNMATTYELGLGGTTDSILDLGALDKIEGKAIPLVVKTSMTGLEGLQNIDFLSVVQFYPNYLAGFTFVTSVVNIHNPSQLTLNIGDMGIAYKGYREEDRIGYIEIFNLRLVPGDNIVPSLLGQSYTAANAGPFRTAFPLFSPTMTLRANSTAISNPALSAGLSTLRTVTVLPQGLVVPTPPPPRLHPASSPIHH